MAASSSIAFVFPGQGAQFVGMGKDIFETFPAAKTVFETADAVLGLAISQLSFIGPEEQLRQTINAQPAIVTLSLALLAVIQEKANIAPALVAGHSLGEYTALAATGALSFAETIRLARKRGQLMQLAGQEKPGGMAAIIGLEDDVVAEVCLEADVYVANYNSPGQVAISGEKEKITAAMALATARGARKVVPLQVSGAFHTPLMGPAAQGLTLAIASLVLLPPAMPIVANTDARPVATAEAIKKELSLQMTHAVQWQKSVEYMSAQGIDTFVEIGPGKVLTGLIKRIKPEAKTLNISDACSLREFLDKGLS
jgi:[acyl-carrier-protein] S-malonyltransferase